MSCLGGRICVILAMSLFARQRGIPFFALADIVACATPIGLLLGRVANFINGELYGRASDAPWAMVFPDPNSGGVPRHPSQLRSEERRVGKEGDSTCRSGWAQYTIKKNKQKHNIE